MEIPKTQLDFFSRWINKNPTHEGHLVRDGIINESLYKEAKIKILYITKESNNPTQPEEDICKWLRDSIQSTFAIRLSEWSYGILNNFPKFDEIWETKSKPHEAIQKTAIINVKKIAGGSLPHYHEIKNSCITNRSLLVEQIELIQPNLIILGLSFWKELREQLFSNIVWQNSGYGIDIATTESYNLIDFYHPSSRNSGPASYSLLENIIKHNFPAFYK